MIFVETIRPSLTFGVNLLRVRTARRPRAGPYAIPSSGPRDESAHGGEASRWQLRPRACRASERNEVGSDQVSALARPRGSLLAL
jgi:hypothetical protein